MGALVTLLFAFARYGQQQVVKVTDAKQAVAEAAASVEVEDLEWRASELRDARAKTEGDLEKARLELSHLEDHLRRLRERAEQIHQAALALDGSDAQAAEIRDGAELAKIHERIALTKRELELAKENAAQKPTTYSIVPYAGPNQTRRRPIYLECRTEGIVLEPEGIVFGDQDFAVMGPGNPLAAAVRAAREFMAETDPNGFDKVEPYPLIVVRPDAIPQYYAARAALASFGSQFGYELIGSDKTLKFPDPDPTLAERLKLVVAEARMREAALIAAAPKQYRKPKTFQVKQGGGGIERVPDGQLAQNDRNPYRGLGRGAGGAKGSWGKGKGNGGGTSAGDGTGGGNSAMPSTTTGSTLGGGGSVALASGNGGNYGGGDGNGNADGGGNDPFGSGGPTGNGGGGYGPGGGPGGNGAGTGPGGANNGPAGPGGFGTGNAPAGLAMNGGGPAYPPGGGNGAGRYPPGGTGDGGAPGGGFIGGPNGAGAPGGTVGGYPPGGYPPGGNNPGGGAGGTTNGRGNGNNLPTGTGNVGKAGGVPGSNLSALADNTSPGKAGGGQGGDQSSGAGTDDNGDGTDNDTDGNGGDANGGNAPGAPGQMSNGSGGGSGGRLALGGQNQPASNEVPGNSPGGGGTPLTTQLQGTGGTTAGNTNGTGSGTGPGGGGLGGLGGKGAGNGANTTPDGKQQYSSNGGPAAPTSRAQAATNANAWNLGGGADDTGPSNNPYNTNASGNSSVGSSKSQNSNSNSSSSSSNSKSASSNSSSSGNSGGTPGSGNGDPPPPGQQSPVGMPNLNFGQKPKQQDPNMGKHGKKLNREGRPKGWGLPESVDTSTAIARPVVVECWPDKLAIVDEDGKSIEKQIPMNGQTDDAVDELVSSVLQHTKQWGSAGKGLSWKPTLSVRVAPTARQRFGELQAALVDSGLDVKESSHKPSLAGKPAKAARK